jgi:hypothetical protein
MADEPGNNPTLTITLWDVSPERGDQVFDALLDSMPDEVVWDAAATLRPDTTPTPGHATDCSWRVMPAPGEEPCDGSCLTPAVRAAGPADREQQNTPALEGDEVDTTPAEFDAMWDSGAPVNIGAGQTIVRTLPTPVPAPTDESATEARERGRIADEIAALIPEQRALSAAALHAGHLDTAIGYSMKAEGLERAASLARSDAPVPAPADDDREAPSDDFDAWWLGYWKNRTDTFEHTVARSIARDAWWNAHDVARGSSTPTTTTDPTLTFTVEFDARSDGGPRTVGPFPSRAAANKWLDAQTFDYAAHVFLLAAAPGSPVQP